MREPAALVVDAPAERGVELRVAAADAEAGPDRVDPALAARTQARLYVREILVKPIYTRVRLVSSMKS